MMTKFNQSLTDTDVQESYPPTEWQLQQTSGLGQTRQIQTSEIWSDDDRRRTRLIGTARLILNVRLQRRAAFRDIKFTEPTWNMALDLFSRHLAGQLVTTLNLCAVSGVPQTTALRSISAMVEGGHFIRRRDPADARRVYVHLSAPLVEAMENYLSGFGGKVSALFELKRPA
jgi:hypothetical protein